MDPADDFDPHGGHKRARDPWLVVAGLLIVGCLLTAVAALILNRGSP